jgi:hypothetical protein
MPSFDWSLLLGLALSVPLSIIANILTPRLIAYLERRRLIKTNKTREQAQRIYERIKDFREGKRDRYVSYLLLATCAIISSIVGATLVLVLISVPASFDARMTGGLCVFLAFLFSAIFLISIYTTADRIANFDSYERQHKKLWGDQ